jgi:hypothetical protein
MRLKILQKQYNMEALRNSSGSMMKKFLFAIEDIINDKYRDIGRDQLKSISENVQTMRHLDFFSGSIDLLEIKVYELLESEHLTHKKEYPLLKKILLDMKNCKFWMEQPVVSIVPQVMEVMQKRIDLEL